MFRGNSGKAWEDTSGKGFVFAERSEMIQNRVRQTVTVDKEYITRSIYYPDEEVVTDYNKGLMLYYQEQITEQEIDKPVEYQLIE